MIDTRNDELLGLCQAAAQCPAVDGKKPHASSIWRWMRQGCRGVRLEHVKVGRRVVTTREALEEFFRATAQASLPPVNQATPPAKGRTSAQRDHALEQARKRLTANGVKIGGAQ